MTIFPVPTGNFKLDGGAMFGVVPKSIWQRINPPDENNMCTWSMRCMLVQHENRLVLIDNGIGDKQDEKFFGHYFLHGSDTLEGSLKKLGFSFADITDVVLTHLHFDHCGGSIRKNKHGKFVPSFPNATYWSNEKHWEWATKPNPREKASFLKENILPISESGQLKFIEEGSSLFKGFDFHFVHGHTESMMIPLIKYKERTIAFMADLLPSAGHIPLPYVMAYDTRPLLTLTEKEKFLNRAADENFILFFEHDAVNECATVQKTEKGVRLAETFTLAEAAS